MMCAKALELRGAILENAESFSRALAHVEKIDLSELLPAGKAHVLYEKGRLSWHLDDFSKAVLCFTEAYEHFPSLLPLIYRLDLV